MYYVCKLSLTSQFGNKACYCCCCSVVQKIPEYMQFGFRFKILLFSTSVRFSTKTLAYLTYKAFIACEAYKAFMAFKCSRLSPFQKYRSVTSFRMDCPRTIRLVYASVSILSVCTIKLQVIVSQKRCTSTAKSTTPKQIKSG